MAANVTGSSSRSRQIGGWEIIKELGSGSFGKVYLVQAVKGNDRTKYALKQMKPPRSSKAETHLQRELEILKIANSHPNCVEFHSTQPFQKRLIFIMEYCRGGTLFEFVEPRLSNPTPLCSEAECKHIVRQMFDAIEFLHDNNVAHRDLKPENILFADQQRTQVKNADFGLSKVFPSKKSAKHTRLGSVHYSAPEIFKSEYGLKCDVWSIGVILFIMVCGNFPFTNQRQIKTRPPQIDKCCKGVSPTLIQFIKDCLTKDPNKRPSSEQCVNHKWLQRPKVYYKTTDISQFLRQDLTRVLKQEESLVIDLVNTFGISQAIARKHVNSYFKSMKNVIFPDLERVVQANHSLDCLTAPQVVTWLKNKHDITFDDDVICLIEEYKKEARHQQQSVSLRDVNYDDVRDFLQQQVIHYGSLENSRILRQLKKHYNLGDQVAQQLMAKYKKEVGENIIEIEDPIDHEPEEIEAKLKSPFTAKPKYASDDDSEEDEEEAGAAAASGGGRATTQPRNVSVVVEQPSTQPRNVSVIVEQPSTQPRNVAVMVEPEYIPASQEPAAIQGTRARVSEVTEDFVSSEQIQEQQYQTRKRCAREPKKKVVFNEEVNFAFDIDPIPEDKRKAAGTRWWSGKKLGKGAGGEVFKGSAKIAMDSVTGAKIPEGCAVAIKRISLNKSKYKNKERLGRVYREIEMLKQVSKHPNCVHLLDCEEYTNPHFLYIVMEYCRGGSLFDAFQDHMANSETGWPEERLFPVVQQMCNALRFLHAQQIAHRDLKLENVLFLDEARTIVKLADFGFSKTFKEDRAKKDTVLGTVEYLAPEVMSRKFAQYGVECDIWSLGVMIYVLTVGFYPFGVKKSRRGTIQPVSTPANFNDEKWNTVSDELKNLTAQCLLLNPQNRITVDGILAHLWITSMEQAQAESGGASATPMCEYADLQYEEHTEEMTMMVGMVDDFMNQINKLKQTSDSILNQIDSEGQHIYSDLFHNAGKEGSWNQAMKYLNVLMNSGLVHKPEDMDDLELPSENNIPEVDGSNITTMEN